MKKFLLSLLLLPILIVCIATTAYCQSNQLQRSFAMPGDTVWVIVNTVKPSKREDFERFLHVIFWPGASKLSKEEQKVFQQTRILHPVAPEVDGTYSYLFIMDPVLKGGNYDIMHLLTKMYGSVKAKEYNKLLSESMVGEQKTYTVVQSR